MTDQNLQPTPSHLPAPERQKGQANKRGVARLAACQALYQMDITGVGVLEIAAEYEIHRLGQEIDGAQYLTADAQWFRLIIAGVVKEQRQLDPLIHQNLPENWPLARLDPTLRAILRAGIWELKNRHDVPIAVIIAEYVDIAKAFFAGEEPKLTHALLDHLAKNLRAN